MAENTSATTPVGRGARAAAVGDPRSDAVGPFDASGGPAAQAADVRLVPRVWPSTAVIPMTATRHPDPATEFQAVVAVRVPQADGDDLTTSASRRLEAGPEIETVDVVEMRGLDPTLSATVVTLAVEVRASATPDDETVAACLDAAPGTEQVEEVRPA